MPNDPENTFDAVQAAAELAAALSEEPPPSDDGNRYTTILEDEVETLGRLLAEREQALQSAHEKAADALAEVDRVRARIERDAAGTIERTRRAVLVSFLEVADDLDRAVEQLSAHAVAPALAQGVRMVQGKLNQVLHQHGARRRPSRGLPFDPAHHEAVGTVRATDAAAAGLIAEVVREGYEVAGETLRAARVVVATE